MAEGASEVTERSPWPARAAEMAGVFMIGDGLLGLFQTERHVALWQEDALGAEVTVRPFVNHPWRRRGYAVAQIVTGLWLASRQRERR